MSTPRLGIVINDDNKALRVARHDDPVDLVVLRSTLINPPRAAAATRLREMISGVHPEAEIIPYIWHLVSHGPSDGLREHGSRSLPGEARAFGLLQESEEVRQAWAIVRACAEGLGATKMVLRTPASFTPGATYRERLRRFAEARAAEGLGLVWEAEGLWEPAMTLPLARELDMTPEKVVEVQKYGREPISLSTPLGEDGDSEFGDLIEDSEAIVPADAVSFTLLQEQLESVLDTLSEREAGVVRMRFGLSDGQPKTLDEIGKVYGVTRERIRQIESKTMSKLRHPSRSQVLRDYLD